jgi:hypothetical protein
MAATRIDPNNPLQPPPAPAPAPAPGGATRIDPNAPAPAPTTSVTSGQPGGASVIDPNQGSQAGTGSWSDFARVAGNESMMNSLPGLRAQVEAARQRLGPNWAAAADATGGIASPSSLLNIVPGVGPELAGGVHEGVRSYMSQPNWWPTPEARTQIAKDIAFGAATGGLGHVGAAYAPKALPFLTEEGLRGGLGAAAAHYIDESFGSLGADLVGFTGLYKALNKPGEWLGSQAEKIADQPAIQNAIKLVTQGAGAALRASSPSSQWDQWVPWQ